MEHCQWVFHLPLNACTRHGQSSFTHLTSYIRLPHLTTLNSFLRDIDHSLTASLTASMVGYLDPSTTSFSLYSHSGHRASCTIGLPKPCFLYSAGTCSPSSSDESPPCCICSASLIFIVYLFHDYGNSLSLIYLSLWFCFSYMHLFILFFLFLSLSLFLHLCTSGTFIFLSSGCNLWLLVTLNKHGKRPPTLKCRFHVHLPASGVMYGHQLPYDTFICPCD